MATPSPIQPLAEPLTALDLLAMDSRTAPPVARLFEQAQTYAWHLDKDLPWDEPVADDDALVDPAWSPFGRTHTFQGLPAEVQRLLARRSIEDLLAKLDVGESVAVQVCARLVAHADRHEDRQLLAAQTLEEARHQAAIRRLRERAGAPAALSEEARELFDGILAQQEPVAMVATLQLMLEGRGLRVFHGLRTAATHPLLRALAVRFHQDEVRHVGYGICFFERLVGGLDVEGRRRVAGSVLTLLIADLEQDGRAHDLEVALRALRAANVNDPWKVAYRMAHELRALDAEERRGQAEGLEVWPSLLAARRAGLLARDALEGLPVAEHPLIEGALRAGLHAGAAAEALRVVDGKATPPSYPPAWSGASERA